MKVLNQMKPVFFPLLFLVTFAFSSEDYTWSYITNLDIITSFAEYNGSVFVGTTGGLASVSKSDLSVKLYLKPDIPLESNNISSVGADSSGNLYVISLATEKTNRITIFDGTSWSIRTDTTLLTSFSTPVTTSNGNLHILEKSECTDQSGNIWSMGIYPKYFDGDTTRMILNGLPDTSILMSSTKLICSSNNGDVFFLYGSIIYVFKGNFWKDTLHFSGIGELLPWKIAVCNSSFFLATEKGLYELTASGIIRHSVESGELPGNNVKSLYVDKSENLWGATDKGGFFHDKTSWKKLDLNYCGLPSNEINALESDLKGNVWVLTHSEVSLYNHGNWKTWKGDSIGFSTISTFEPRLAVTRNAAYLAQGEEIFKCIEGNWVRVTEYISPEGDDIITSICGDRTGNVWCGTFHNGLYKIDSNDSVTNINPSESNTGLSGMISDIYVDAGNTVWFQIEDNK